MNSLDLLILHGPPGSGKSSIAKVMSKRLSDQGTKHTVIELDDLAKIFPKSLLGIMYKNLSAIWPNYVALGNIKVIIPTYLQVGELEIVKKAAPAKRVTVIEMTVHSKELKRRITDREPNGVIRKRLLDYLDKYEGNRTEDRFIDFKIANTSTKIEDTANKIVKKLGW